MVMMTDAKAHASSASRPRVHVKRFLGIVCILTIGAVLFAISINVFGWSSEVSLFDHWLASVYMAAVYEFVILREKHRGSDGH